MKRFIQTKFFRVLRENPENDNLEKLYVEFVKIVFAESNQLSLFDYRNALCYAKVEFVCLQNLNKMKKKQNSITFF
jgi:hypothetical protein